MKLKSSSAKKPNEQLVEDIRCATRNQNIHDAIDGFA